MDVPAYIGLDESGLLRKECPHCKTEYKIFLESETEERKLKSYCPLCGLHSSADQQFTKNQVEYLNQVIQSHAIELINKSFGKMQRKMNNPVIEMKFKPLKKEDPRTLIEMDDFTEVITGCCKEPVFLDNPNSLNIIYCPSCGDINFRDY